MAAAVGAGGAGVAGGLSALLICLGPELSSILLLHFPGLMGHSVFTNSPRPQQGTVVDVTCAG